MTADRPGRGLRTQMIVAFGLLSLVAVAVLIAVEQLGAGLSLDALDRVDREAVAASSAGLAAEAFVEAGSWEGADLSHARATAEGAGARLNIIAGDGTNVSGPPPGGGDGHGEGPESRASDVIVVPIQHAGTTLGTARLIFISADYAAHRAHDYLWGWALVAGGAGLVAATATGWWVAGRLSRPLRELSGLAQQFANGDRTSRSGITTGPAEVVHLATALDTMADTIEATELAEQATLADVAHELRNPLAVLQGELEEMRDGYAPADTDALTSLHLEAVRLGRVLDDLALLAERRPAELVTLSDIDLASVADQAVAARRTMLRSAGLHVTAQTAAAPTYGDPDRLGQVVGNLLQNCQRYCRSGDTVRVATGPAGDEVYLSVTDDGPGILASDQPHVFEREYRAPGRSNTAGYGIGLAVVHRLVEAHAGRLELTSEPGGGTRVVIWLPRAAAHAEGSQAADRVTRDVRATTPG